MPYYPKISKIQNGKMSKSNTSLDNTSDQDYSEFLNEYQTNSPNNEPDNQYEEGDFEAEWLVAAGFAQLTKPFEESDNNTSSGDSGDECLSNTARSSHISTPESTPQKILSKIHLDTPPQSVQNSPSSRDGISFENMCRETSSQSGVDIVDSSESSLEFCTDIDTKNEMDLKRLQATFWLELKREKPLNDDALIRRDQQITGKDSTLVPLFLEGLLEELPQPLLTNELITLFYQCHALPHADQSKALAIVATIIAPSFFPPRYIHPTDKNSIEEQVKIAAQYCRLTNMLIALGEALFQVPNSLIEESKQSKSRQGKRGLHRRLKATKSLIHSGNGGTNVGDTNHYHLPLQESNSHIVNVVTVDGSGST